MNNGNEKVRIDKYLWAIRIFKTRNIAKECCESGRVKFNGKSTKSAHAVAINEIYTIHTDDRLWTIKVTGVVANRGSYAVAIQNYEDLTPAAEINKKQEKQTAKLLYRKTAEQNRKAF